MRAFLVLLTIAATSIATIAAAAEWRPQFLLGCRSGCTQQAGLSADVCLQICNCAASEMEANFGNEPLGSIGVPSAEPGTIQCRQLRTVQIWAAVTYAAVRGGELDMTDQA